MSNGVNERCWASLPYRALLSLLALAIALSALLPAHAAQDTPAIGSEIIVVLEEGEDPITVARDMGVEVEHVYRHVFNGFAGTVTGGPPETASAARVRRAAKSISPDGRVTAEAQVIPTGVSRAGTPYQPGATNLDIPSPVDTDIAILDTGIAGLADLNVVGGVSCLGDPNAWQDDNGHGTHVAGIAAALDNDVGVVGVAPGARLWAVKVLDSRGSGSFSDVICGLDWVAGNADTIDVANLSLSGAGHKGDCTSPALHAAVCAVVAAGVPIVVAAGNQATNADTRVPASFDEVITVSGITDSDGKPGHLGPKPCYGDIDDSFLSFSNFGASVDIAAPGGCILSYGPSGSLEIASGTSEASPHVAGAAANFVARFAADHGGRPSPDQVRSWLLTEASRPQSVDGVTGDPDSSEAKQRALKKKIKKAKKKVKKSKGKKSRKRHKKKLKKLKRTTIQEGPLEPVLWLQVLG